MLELGIVHIAIL